MKTASSVTPIPPPGNTAATEQQEVAAEEEVTEVYPEEATRTERKTIPGSEPKAKPKPRPKARPASKQEYRQPKVIMYSTSSCGYCTMAREWFRRNDVKFTEYNVDKSRQARDQFHALNGRGVPLIFVGSQRINGFSSSLIRQALGR